MPNIAMLKELMVRSVLAVNLSLTVPLQNPKSLSGVKNAFGSSAEVNLRLQQSELAK